MIDAGSLVICVKDDFPVYIWIWANDLPRKGNIYTVKEVACGREPVTGDSGPGVILFELDNPFPCSSGQVQFATWRFREYFVDLDEKEESRETQEIGA